VTNETKRLQLQLSLIHRDLLSSPMQAGAADLRLETAKKNKIRAGVRGNLANGRIAANKLVRRGCSAGEQCAVHSSGHSGTKVTVYLRLILHCVGGGEFKKAKKCNIPGGVLISFS